MQPVQTHLHAGNGNRFARNVPGRRLGRRCVAALVFAPMLPAAESAVNAHVYVASTHWTAARSFLGRWEAISRMPNPDGLARPSKDALAAGRKFLRQAEAGRIAAPAPYIDEDGEFGFRWTSATGLASVSFMPDGNLVAYIYSEDDGLPPLEVDDRITANTSFNDLIARINNLS